MAPASLRVSAPPSSAPAPQYEMRSRQSTEKGPSSTTPTPSVVAPPRGPPKPIAALPPPTPPTDAPGGRFPTLTPLAELAAQHKLGTGTQPPPSTHALVPLRLDIDVGGVRALDTLTWDLHGSLITPEHVSRIGRETNGK